MTAQDPLRLVRIEAGIFLLLFAGLAIAGRTAMFGDPGTYWHIEVGRILAESGKWIETDPFSFTKSGRPWIAMQWLGEWMMYRIVQIASYDGLLATACAIVGWTFATIAGRWLRAGMHWLPTCLLLSVVLAASSHHFLIRPHLASMAFTAWITVWILRFEREEVGLSNQPAFVFAAFVVWTNIHAGALGGVVTLSLAAFGWWAAKGLGWPQGVRDPRRLWTATACATLAAASIFVNPYGTRLPKVWLSLSGAQELQTMIEEHRRLSPLQPTGMFVIALTAVYLALLASSPLSSWRVSWALPLPWLAMAFDRVRHAPLFAIVAAIVAADMAASSRRLAAAGSDLFQAPTPEQKSSRSSLGIVAALTFVLWIGLASAFKHVEAASVKPATWLAGIDQSVAPIDLLPELVELMKDKPDDVRVLNDLNFGGFVAHFWPGRKGKSFIDDRCELFADLLPAYCNARDGKEERLNAWLQQHRPDFALLETGRVFDLQLRKRTDWRLVSETPTAALFVPLAKPER